MGYPSRISRTALGPIYEDRRPVKDPTREVGRTWVNLVSWQVAGGSVVGPLAKVFVESDGETRWASEAWDPNGDSAPTTTRVSPGVYQVVYAASYPDDEGTLITTALKGAAAFPQTTSDRRAVALVAGDGRTIDVTVRDDAGAVIDCPFLLEVS